MFGAYNDPILRSEMTSGMAIMLIMLGLFLMIPCMWGFTTGSYYVRSNEGIVVKKKAYIANYTDWDYLKANADRKLLSKVKNINHYSPPLLYVEYYANDGKTPTASILTSSSHYSRSKYTFVILSRYDWDTYEMNVSRDEFYRYDLGTVMRKRSMANYWLPGRRRYSYYDYYTHYYYPYHRDSYYGYHHRYYGSRARTSGYNRGPYGTGFRGK